MIYIIYYFLFYANPLPFLHPRSLNLHNRQVDDHVAGEEEEVLLEGVGMEMEAEEMGQDLPGGVVCQKNYEEPESCGSAADFLLGVEMEGDTSGREEVEAAVSSLEVNDSNKCHADVDVDIAFDDIQDLLPPVDVNLAVGVEMEAEEMGQDLSDVNLAVNNDQDFNATTPVDVDQVEDYLAVDKHLPVKSKRKMPKRKKKFGKGAKRGGDRKSCRQVDPSALVDPTALVNPTALVAMERPTATAAVPVKRMNKKQLHRSLHCTTKKLICAKKKATTTAKKLSAAKAQCTTLAKIARDRRKESNLAHQNAESKVNAIRDEMAVAKALCDNAVAKANAKVIAERVFLSTQAKAKAKAAVTRKQHAKQLLLKEKECDITIDGMKHRLRSTLKRNNKKSSVILNKQAAKSRVSSLLNRESSSSATRRIMPNPKPPFAILKRRWWLLKLHSNS